MRPIDSPLRSTTGRPTSRSIGVNVCGTTEVVLDQTGWCVGEDAVDADVRRSINDLGDLNSKRAIAVDSQRSLQAGNKAAKQR
jgi:hypothetical protein